MKLFLEKTAVLFLSLALIFSFWSILFPYVSRKLSSHGITPELNNHISSIDLLMVISMFIFSFIIANRSKRINKISPYFICVFTGIIFAIIAISSPRANNYLILISYMTALIIGFIPRLANTIFLKIMTLFIFGSFCYSFINFIKPIDIQINDYGNWNGEFNTEIEGSIKLYNTINEPMIDLTIKDDRIYVIDFWNNSCGICYKKFPEFITYQESNENPKVDYIAVNVYNKKSEIQKSILLLNKTGNEKLVTYYLDTRNTANLKLEWFPQVMVIKNNTILFKGQLEAFKIFKNQILNR